MASGAADLPTLNANLRTFSRFRKVLKFVPPKIWYNLRRKSGENHDEEESRKNALPELAGTVQGQASHKGLDRHAPCRQIDHPSDVRPVAQKERRSRFEDSHVELRGVGERTSARRKSAARFPQRQAGEGEDDVHIP